MKINETQAISIAKQWLEHKHQVSLPLRGAVYVPEGKAGGAEGYIVDQPARWLLVFQCDAPESFHPNQVDVFVDPETGEIEELQLI